MSERFIKFIPSVEAMYLVTQKGNAFRLLTIIANLARRHSGDPDGLEIGEAFLGDWKSYGMTEQNYRTAKKVLIQRQHLKIIETNRNRKKSTTGVTTEGTRVKLLSSSVYDINIIEPNDRSNDCLTTAQRLPNDEQEREEAISNDIAKKVDAQPAPQPRTKDSLLFDFQKMAFEGISEKDKADWKLMYPCIELHVEILKAEQWLKTNPSKSRKSLWRKYLTGWLQRANEKFENKAAYRAALSTQTGDRRTKTKDGVPVHSDAEELF